MQLLRASRTQPWLKISLTLSLVTTILLHANQAAACAACGCTLSKDWQTQGINTAPGFSLNLTYDYLNQNQQRYGSSKASSTLINTLNNNGMEIEDYTKTQTVTASLNYTADSWGAILHVPFVKRTHGTFGNPGYPGTSTYASSSDNSIGDVSIVGRYTGLSADRSAGLIAGIKLPTGNTGATFSDGVTPLDAGLQIGTGSTDVILGGYTSGGFDKYGWFVQGTVQHAVATKLALGGATYRPGDAYSLNTGIRYAVFGAKFSPMLQLNIVKREADTGTGVPLDVLTNMPISGGTLAYLAPGLSMRVGGGTSIYGFVQLPVYQSVNSLQIVPHYVLSLGLQKSFE